MTRLVKGTEGTDVADPQPKPQPRRRQARGRQRIEAILSVAEQVIAEVGYRAATTNAIAARAGISPGSLYQFFANKDAIADALAARYTDQLGRAQQKAFTGDITTAPLPALIDQIIDPLIAFNLAHPAFHVLFTDPDTPQPMANATAHLHQLILDQVDTLIATRAPAVPSTERTLAARISVQLFRALLPLVTNSRGRNRHATTAELKKVLHAYLQPYLAPP
jgi:AcrR family transcriptional regulator